MQVSLILENPRIPMGNLCRRFDKEQGHVISECQFLYRPGPEIWCWLFDARLGYSYSSSDKRIKKCPKCLERTQDFNVTKVSKKHDVPDNNSCREFNEETGEEISSCRYILNESIKRCYFFRERLEDGNRINDTVKCKSCAASLKAAKTESEVIIFTEEGICS